MIALILAAALAATPNYDTVTTADGSRVIGTVLEESPTKGVTVQLADGTTRHLERNEVRRIEFSDGSTTVWEASSSPAAPEKAAPAAPPAPAAQPGLDTVYFTGGGRVRGHVIEEHPKDGVTVKLADGSVRHYAPEEIARIQYADGFTSRRTPLTNEPHAVAQPKTAPPYPPYPPNVRPPAPSYYPPPPPPGAFPPPPPPGMYPPPPGMYPQPLYARPVEGPRNFGMRPISPVTASIGVGGTFFSGQAQGTTAMTDVFQPQLHLSLEGGVRLDEHVVLAVYYDVGGGDVGSSVRTATQCPAGGPDCTGETQRVGLMLKRIWNPSSLAATWLGIGTGYEWGTVNWQNGYSGGSEVFTYSGHEWGRLAAGVDMRTSPVIGFGLYTAVSFGTYDNLHYPSSNPPPFSGDQSIAERVHETFEVGVRLILFP